MRNETNYEKLNGKELKIKNLYWLNRLNTIAKLMVSKNIEPIFYDYYFVNDINWLAENQDKIESDLKKYMNERLEDLKFDIILNTDLDERVDLIVSINNVKEFSNYIIYGNETAEEAFKKFKSLDDYDKLIYFERIRRR